MQLAPFRVRKDRCAAGKVRWADIDLVSDRPREMNPKGPYLIYIYICIYTVHVEPFFAFLVFSGGLVPCAVFGEASVLLLAFLVGPGTGYSATEADSFRLRV